MNFRSLFFTTSALFMLSACGPEASDSELSSLVGTQPICGGIEVPDNSLFSNYYCAGFNFFGKRRETLFRFDGFTADQVKTLKSSLEFAMNVVDKHFREKGRNSEKNISTLMQCVFDDTRKDVFPRGYPYGTDKNSRDMTHEAMKALAYLQQYHEANKKIAVIKAYVNADEPTNTGRASVGSYPEIIPPNLRGTMDFSINTVALENDDFGAVKDRIFAGTMIHELLHRAGWEHPTGYEGGSFIVSVENCAFFSQLSLTQLPTYFADEGMGEKVEPKKPDTSFLSGKCQYKHRFSDQGGKRGEINFKNALGRMQFCDRNGDWQNSCKDSKSSTEEVACLL